MWASWRQNRREIEEIVGSGESFPDIEREIGDRINSLQSTPRNERVQRDWNPSPILGAENTQQTQQEITSGEESISKSSSKLRRRRFMKGEKYKSNKRQINRHLRDDEQLLVNYTELELSNDKIKVGWRGKNFMPDRRHINRTDTEAGLSRL